MTFISVAFDYHDTQYTRLANVLEKSIRKNCPKADLILKLYPPPDVPEFERVNKRFGENSEKLNLWIEHMKDCEDQNIVLIDCDMMVLDNISEIFNEDFDIAVTRHNGDRGRIPYNGGVICVKKSDKTNLFFNEFLQINNKMYKDREFHEPWRTKYAGMNQAAFGYMLENYDSDINIMEIPCSIYNLCSEDWGKFNKLTPRPKIIHLKGALRNICLSDSEPIKYGNIRNIWREFENGNK